MRIEDFQPTEVQWCELCRPHVAGECDGCHRKFDSGERQYRSSSHHFHPKSIAGVAGTVAIHKDLCVDCYRKDYESVYSASAPALPDRGMDPQFFATAQRELARKSAVDLLRRAIDGKATEAERKQLEAMLMSAIQ